MIPNFFQYNSLLASGAQPSEEDIRELKNNGYQVIVNISPSSTRNALANEAQITENYGIDYVHFPVDCSNLRPTHYNVFKGILNGLADKKVFVHCGGNIKSSNLLHMYHVIEKRVDERESLQILKKIQNPEPKWFVYFKSMGMKGLEQ